MKQEGTQTIHLSLGLTQPEHNLIHPPWASIHPTSVSPLTEAGSGHALEAKAGAVPVWRVQSLLQPMSVHSATPTVWKAPKTYWPLL